MTRRSGWPEHKHQQLVAALARNPKATNNELGWLLDYFPDTVRKYRRKMCLNDIALQLKRKPWTEERISKLRALASIVPPLRHQKIADEFEVSRNTISKKLSDLGLTEKKLPKLRDEPLRQPYIPVVAIVPKIHQPPLVISPAKECQYTESEHRPWVFCNKPTHWHICNGALVRSSFCEEHHALCWQKSSRQQQEAA